MIFILLYYHNQYCIIHLTSFFDHQIIFFSRVLLYPIQLFFVIVQSVCWSRNISENISWFIYNSMYLFIYLFIESHFSIIIIFSYLFLVYSVNLNFRPSEYKETIIHTLIHFYTVIQWQATMIFDYYYIFDFSIFIKKIWILLTNIFIISHLIIAIFV